MGMEIRLVQFVLHPAKVCKYVEILPQVKTYLQIRKFVFTCESMKEISLLNWCKIQDLWLSWGSYSSGCEFENSVTS